MLQQFKTEAEPRAQLALSASPIFDLRTLRVEESGNTLCIRGVVASYYHKQMAQEAVLAVADGREVVNELHVSDERVQFYD